MVEEVKKEEGTKEVLTKPEAKVEVIKEIERKPKGIIIRLNTLTGSWEVKFKDEGEPFSLRNLKNIKRALDVEYRSYARTLRQESKHGSTTL